MGPYEIVSPIGSGGMGEVYRARDTRLGRAVAIKILRSAVSNDLERLRRFEQEARAAAALNHPNILVIYDFGAEVASPYIVSELLEGMSLRNRLAAGALPQRLVVNYATQIARGLVAAHQKGIVHRDLKPENLFILKDGRAKILDFGIAKLIERQEASEPSEFATVATAADVVLGTTGYMSPEQVRGKPLDHRSDIFSFGAILYEMLAGQRAFRGDTAADTITAILSNDPLEATGTQRPISPVMERIVHHCLEKDPDMRYQSATDLAFDLQELSGLSETAQAAAAARPKRLRWPRVLAVLVAVAALVGFFLIRNSGVVSPPVYQRLTFLRGTVWSARFAPDGQSVLYSASWNGKPIDIFTTRPEGTEFRSLNLENAELLAISSSGNMAILLKRRYFAQLISVGILAEMPLSGGAPREILEDVQQADWAPDGTSLAVVRIASGRTRLEFPAGKLLFETDGWITYPRVSPKGDKVAFFEHQVPGDNRGWVSVVDLAGKRKRLSGEWVSEQGLAWPNENEIWFAASKAGESHGLYAVSLSGAERVVTRAPVSLMLHDISPTGDVLLSSGNEVTDFIGLAPGEDKERDLSWLDWGSVRDMSSDGKEFIFTHYGEKSGKNYSIYLRKTDGSAAVRLGDGNGWALSPDEKWVLATLPASPQIILLPTGAGEVKRVEKYRIEEYGLGAAWFPDGQRILFIGRESGHAMRCYMQPVQGGAPSPVTPEGVTGTAISPDGKYLVASDERGNQAVYPIAGGVARPIPELGAGDQVIRWTQDGNSLYFFRATQSPIRVYKLVLATGQKLLWREIIPSDPTGILRFVRLFLTADGKNYIYGITRNISNLYRVQKLK